MVEIRTHYPNYKLLDEKDEWDEHTQAIVLKRLGPFGKLKFFQAREVVLLKALATQFTYDSRNEILDYIIHHLDQKLTAGLGESQRAPNTLPADKLIPLGLKALDTLAKNQYQKGFAELAAPEQEAILISLASDSPSPHPDWQQVPPKDLLNKLLEAIISAYYSYPFVWSEIGHGGPAYPRGYYRIEHGLTDPWEAKRSE